jgi:hypothetical protein
VDVEIRRVVSPYRVYFSPKQPVSLEGFSRCIRKVPQNLKPHFSGTYISTFSRFFSNQAIARYAMLTGICRSRKLGSRI